MDETATNPATSAPPPATFSLIVPTRKRPAQLCRFLDSLAETSSAPERLEIVLVIDEDDRDTIEVGHTTLNLKRVLVPPGRTMGALNMAGYEASSGRYLMLLNDDVVARTPGWDETVSKCLAAFPDDLVLVHVNDLIFKDKLCTFPLVSRKFCELAGGICPREYIRYRIDDHIEDIFNLLGVLGEMRTIYLPDVVFEHSNDAPQPDGFRLYASDPDILAQDAPLFDALSSQRKDLALRLKEIIELREREIVNDARRRKLEGIADSFALRVPERLHIESVEKPRSSANTPMTIGILTAGMEEKAFRKCLRRIKSCTANFELIVLEIPKGNGHLPRDLNRLLALARTNHVVLLHDQIAVRPGWLDGLLRSMKLDVGVVVPVQQTRDRKTTFGGVVFTSDSPGNFRHADAPGAAQPVLTFANPVLLVDRSRFRHLQFDEAYRHYFFDLDLGLRFWEAGMPVICTPEATVTSLTGPILPFGPEAWEEVFDRDRQAFIGRWLKNGRLERLEREVWRKVPALHNLLAFDEESIMNGVSRYSPLPCKETGIGTIPTRFGRRLSNAVRELKRFSSRVREKGVVGVIRALGRRVIRGTTIQTKEETLH